ncbi:MAG TPA: indole-3-glycerol phosphate synthase TrpC [Bacteroidetes bacterium]|nr:indole-3-glycerol phosphate synthase TrpC [Bacteroidota bacterium]
MHILEKIIAHKKKEVAERKKLFPIDLLERSLFFKTECVPLVKYLKDENKSGVIAEFKRRSPSKGDINKYASVEQVTIGYMQAGASALSILTDNEFFGGKSADLSEARKYNYCPILRKEFIIDEYQIIEAKSIGADAILLIASCLSAKEVQRLSATAHSLGLQVLMEIHDQTELEYFCENIDIIGVNNRDLKTFKTSVNNSHKLLPLLPDGVAKISESGINDPKDAAGLLLAGFDGLLIGEYFMKNSAPEVACLDFIAELEKCKKAGLVLL